MNDPPEWDGRSDLLAEYFSRCRACGDSAGRDATARIVRERSVPADWPSWISTLNTIRALPETRR